MSCLYLLFALISPRLLLAGLWIFTDYVSNAFNTWLADQREQADIESEVTLPTDEQPPNIVAN